MTSPKPGTNGGCTRNCMRTRRFLGCWFTYAVNILRICPRIHPAATLALFAQLVPSFGRPGAALQFPLPNPNSPASPPPTTTHPPHPLPAPSTTSRPHPPPNSSANPVSPPSPREPTSSLLGCKVCPASKADPIPAKTKDSFCEVATNSGQNELRMRACSSATRSKRGWSFSTPDMKHANSGRMQLNRTLAAWSSARRRRPR